MSTKSKSKGKRLAAASVTEVVKSTEPQTIEQAPPKSIRQTIRQGILAGVSTKDLTVTVQANFPGSAAARKPAKHIAHYRCLMKKEAAVQATATV
jgi:N-acetylneuraminic acid mutarotase